MQAMHTLKHHSLTLVHPVLLEADIFVYLNTHIKMFHCIKSSSVPLLSKFIRSHVCGEVQGAFIVQSAVGSSHSFMCKAYVCELSPEF